MDEGFDGDRQTTVPITASQARDRATKNQIKKSKDVNYTLTIKRLYKIIEGAAEQGNDSLTFKAPAFVLDGCIGDPIILARQLKARLIELGYKVTRAADTLLVSWGEEKQGPSLKSSEKKKRR